MGYFLTLGRNYYCHQVLFRAIVAKCVVLIKEILYVKASISLKFKQRRLRKTHQSSSEQGLRWFFFAAESLCHPEVPESPHSLAPLETGCSQ